MLTIDEQRLIIEGCIQFRRRAQQDLYKAYYKTMITICLRYTKNEMDAVEVLNNGFLKIFKNIQRYHPIQGSLYTWMRIIVINSCIDFIKQKSRHESMIELSDDNDVHLPFDIISKLRANELLALVRSLPPATAAVFNLYVVEGFNHREIAGLLNISEGTSKWHLSQGRKSLQQKIKIQDQLL